MPGSKHRAIRTERAEGGSPGFRKFGVLGCPIYAQDKFLENDHCGTPYTQGVGKKRRVWWIVGALVAAVVLFAAVAFLVSYNSTDARIELDGGRSV